MSKNHNGRTVKISEWENSEIIRSHKAIENTGDKSFIIQSHVFCILLLLAH